MRTWLIIDVSCLCFRAFHTTGGLRHGDQGTGIIFGVLRDIVTFSEMFLAHGVIFAFDDHNYDRRKLYPEYKKKRKPPSPEEAELYDTLYTQVHRLYEKTLPEIGFKNIFKQSGKEADDIIASLCYDSLEENDDAIIISADKDLWQLLNNRVRVYNPIKKQTTSYFSFVKTLGIKPKQWITVKCLAGCNSDNIQGIPGVGEKTAIAYLRGLLKSGSKAESKILNGVRDGVIERNKGLVRLPIKGTNYFDIVLDHTKSTNWNRIVSEFGMRSLHNQLPKYGNNQ